MLYYWYMAKPEGYSDRQMKPKRAEREYFFPKHNPPCTVKAKSRKEAEQKLNANKKDNE